MRAASHVVLHLSRSDRDVLQRHVGDVGDATWLYSMAIVLRMFYRGMAMREMPCCRQHLCCFCLSEFVRSKLTKQLGGEVDAAGGSPSLEEVMPPCGPVLLPQGMACPTTHCSLLATYCILLTTY